MRRVTRRYDLSFLTWTGLLALLLFLFLWFPTVTAFDPPGDQGPPLEVVPPHMDFQVPANAASMPDFVPPGLDLVQMAVIPGQPLVTPPISPNGLAVGMGDKLGVVVEENTFPQPVRIHMSQLDIRPFPISATNTISSPISGHDLMRFKLDAKLVNTGDTVDAFDKPLRLVVDLRGLTADHNPVLSDYYLAYRDQEDPSIWHEVPATLHQSGGLISAEVMHFSEWATGVRPERWNPTWNPPAVDLFSGAATFSYPIEVPPGRNGLRPAVALSYNSNGLNGKIHDVDPGPVANGWSLAEISIVRVGVRLRVVYNIPETYHPDRFRLVFNGSGHELAIEPGGDPLSNNPMRYYVKDRPDLRVTRYYDTAIAGFDKLFWVVETPDGTKYRLGSTLDSQEYQRVNNSYHIAVEGHEGRPNNKASAIAWHVDTATDTFGNQMQYDYNAKLVTENIDYYDGTMVLKTYENRIVEISYNYSLRYTGSLPVPEDVARPVEIPGNTAATRIEFHARDEEHEPTDPVSSIYVFHGDSLPMVEYRLDVEKVGADSQGPENLGCWDEDAHIPLKTWTWVLNDIQLWTDTDEDPDTPDGGYPLPAASFSYDPFPNFHKNMYECFRFQRMTGYANGYGGEAAFSFENDGDGDDVRGRATGIYSRTGSLSYIWPDIGYSWHVDSMTLDDGRNPSQMIAYTYSNPCYDQWNTDLEGNWGVMANAIQCMSNDAPEFGPTVGFEWAEQKVYNYQEILIRTEKTQFWRPTPLTGNRIQQEVFDSDDYKLSKSFSSYTYTVNGSTTFAYSQEFQETEYNLGGSPSITTKQTYSYSLDLQDGGQYGNQTVVWDYGDLAVSGDETTTIRCFYPNVSGGHWLVNKLAVERVFDQIQGSPDEGMCAYNYTTDLLYETRSFYDGYNYVSPPLEQGALTKVKKGRYGSELGGAPNGVITTTVMTYDDYGNAQTTTDAAGATTEISYESDYHLYPITVTNDLGHETTFEIYGFNGVSLEPDFAGARRQAGLLRKATDPNGLEVIYEYDPFGRLFNTYDSEADLGTLADRWDGTTSMRYRYWDNTWNHGSVQWLEPQNDEPFAILERSHPDEFPGENYDYEITTLTYFDGFGRPIQQQDLTAEVDGQAYRRDIIVTTGYNAKGKVGCVTVPRDVPTIEDRVDWPYQTSFLDDNCESLDHTTTNYDDIGRPITVTDPSGAQTTTIYDIVDNTTVNGVSVLHRVRSTDADDHRTNRFYDSRGRLVKVREHLGTVSGGLSAYADTEYTYDWQGNLTGVQNRMPHQSGGGDLLSETTMTYDALSRKVSMDDADMGQWYYQYDAAGNLVRQEDANGQVICLYYDSLNRPVRKVGYDNPLAPPSECPTLASAPTDGNNHLASYQYDTAANGLGKQAEVSWGASPGLNNDVFSYDSRGRVVTQTRTLDDREYTMATTSYDSLDRPVRVQYPDGEIVIYSYDREGQESIQAGSNYLVNFMKYNARSQLTQILRATSTVHSQYSYYPMTGNPGTGNNNGRLESLQYGSTGDDFPDYTYEYDPAGNITQIAMAWTDPTAKSDIQQFTYDALDRLKDAGSQEGDIGDYDHTYSYDEIGNITSRREGTTTYNYSYPQVTPPDQPHAVSSVTKTGFSFGMGGGTTPVYSFEYDVNGNMIGRDETEAGVDYDQDFDVQNRLVKVIDGGTVTTTFAYDAGEVRTRTIVATSAVSRTVTYYPFPNYEQELVQIWEEQGGHGPSGQWVTQAATQRSTYSIGGIDVAVRVSGLPQPENAGIFYFITDHLGSTTMLAYGNDHPPLLKGKKVPGSEAIYLPYGDYRAAPTTEIADRGFTGHRHNNYIKLVDMKARWYDQAIGRFINPDTIVPDPANPQSYNRYAYALNNPVRYVDPSGHVECESDQWCGPATSSNPLFHPMAIVSFNGESFTRQEMASIETAALMAGREYAQAINKQNRLARKNGITSSYHQVDAREAFIAVHGGPVSFVGVDDNPGFLGERTGLGLITVHLGERAYISTMWALHELGHDLNAHAIRAGNDYGQPYVDLRIQGIWVRNENRRIRVAGNTSLESYLSDASYVRELGLGYQDTGLPWVQNEALTAGEDFADMFANWVAGGFTSDRFGNARHRWMESNMISWVSLAVSYNQ